MDNQEKPGATGRFPYGKLYSDDKGELAVRISADPANGMIRLDFGVSVSWVCLPPDQARQVAAVLITKAEQCEKAIAAKEKN